jgi:hypothetical protein
LILLIKKNIDMEQMVLGDKSVRPNDELIFSIIGGKSIFWKKIISHLHESYTDIIEEWNYYNDGKSWLFRVQKKKKTIFWIRVLPDTFRVGFFLSDKGEALIENSDLSESVKEEFRNAKRYKIGRNVSILITNSEDVDNVIKLIGIKIQINSMHK